MLVTKYNPMPFGSNQDGEARVKNTIWELIYKKSEIDKKYLYDIFCTGYLPTLDTPVKEIKLIPSYSKNNIYKFLGSAVHYEKFEDEEYLEVLRKELDAIPKDEKVVIPMSGGIDSGLLFCLAKQMEIKLEPVTLNFLNINEIKDARKVCKFFNLNLKIIKVTEKEIVKELPNAISMLGLPMDRGSILPTYFMFKHFYGQGRWILTGDGSEGLIAPSYRSQISMERDKTNYGEGMIKINEDEFSHLFNSWRYYDSPFIFKDSMTNAKLFDILYEEPYFLFKLSQFRHGNVLVLPFLNTKLYNMGLMDKSINEIHPYKSFYFRLLHKIYDHHGFSQRNIPQLFKHYKTPLKVNTKDLLGTGIALKYLDTKLLKKSGLFNENLNPIDLSDRSRYLLTLFSIWYRKYIDCKRWN